MGKWKDKADQSIRSEEEKREQKRREEERRKEEDKLEEEFEAFMQRFSEEVVNDAE